MQNIHESIKDNLQELGVIRTHVIHQKDGRIIDYILDISEFKKLGLTKSTAYRWLKNPPEHFRRTVEKLAQMNLLIRRQRLHSLPESWMDSGWHFIDDDLRCGGNYANPFKFSKERIIMSKNIELSLRKVEQALRFEIREQQRTIDDLKERAKWSVCANDEYILPPIA